MIQILYELNIVDVKEKFKVMDTAALHLIHIIIIFHLPQLMPLFYRFGSSALSSPLWTDGASETLLPCQST